MACPTAISPVTAALNVSHERRRMRSISGSVYSFAMSRIVARAFHFDCTILYCTATDVDL